MKVSCLTVAHYGADYLGHALRSVEPFVDEMHVVYTPTPSHGTQTHAKPPDTKDEMYAAAMSAGRKMVWHEVNKFTMEGPHRDYALSLCKGDLALVVDCDEVWNQAVLEKALKLAYDGKTRNWLVNFTTPWRSFSWYCTDNLWPVRIIDLRQPKSNATAYIPKEFGAIHHFGYAVRDQVCRYKLLIHGHKAQWRDGWYENKWCAPLPPTDCHPTDVGIWNPAPYDKNKLPGIMREHPFWNLDKIE